MSGCLRESEIEDYLAGLLQQEVRSEFDRHVLECVTCASAVGKGRADDQLFDELCQAFRAPDITPNPSGPDPGNIPGLEGNTSLRNSSLEG